MLEVTYTDSQHKPQCSSLKSLMGRGIIGGMIGVRFTAAGRQPIVEKVVQLPMQHQLPRLVPLSLLNALEGARCPKISPHASADRSFPTAHAIVED